MKGREKTKTIQVDYLARVEGEGALLVKIQGEKVIDVKLKIFEPPRFFEALLRGRSYQEAPDITARICGICPVAYQMSAVHAMENALGIRPNNEIRSLRRLMYCGEWIESHVLHIYLLHAPDFLGLPDAVSLAKKSPKIVERGLGLKKVGNEIISLIGGREIHPINVKVGGFYKLPQKKDLDLLLEKLKTAREAALETLDWISTFPFPDYERDYEFVSLTHPTEYPLNEGRITSNKGLDLTADQYDSTFEAEQVAHSNALHSTIKGKGSYFVGPMARYNLNFERLPASVQQLAKQLNLEPPCRNPFKGILIRGLEVLYACEEAIRIIETYQAPQLKSPVVELKLATGYGCTEAPRGMLYHRYRLDDQGIIRDAKIVPPTSQNQKTIEEDILDVVSQNVKMSEVRLTHLCEQTIRNYDPCISCATHFLKLDVQRFGATQ